MAMDADASCFSGMIQVFRGSIIRNAGRTGRPAEYPSLPGTAQGSRMFHVVLAESTGWSSTVLLSRGGSGCIGVPRGKWQMAQHTAGAPFPGEFLQRLVDCAADVVLL